jgi:tRNA pseudouridine32 synthase/23S rRNA pseudouridine746 synthase
MNFKKKNLTIPLKTCPPQEQGTTLLELLCQQWKDYFDNPELISTSILYGQVWGHRGKKAQVLDDAKMLAESVIGRYDKIVHHLNLDVLKELPIGIQDTECFYEEAGLFGVWFKAANILSQGSPFGHHRSLLHLLAKIKKVKAEEIYLIHRLDREVQGIMIYAYSKKMAAQFSALWNNPQAVQKVYLAQVVGFLDPAKIPLEGVIDADLDDKKAKSLYKVVGKGKKGDLVEVTILSGRFHQIRRHLEHIGFPVLGDPLYGKNNKDPGGLKLMGIRLTFRHPNNPKEIKEIKMPFAKIQEFFSPTQLNHRL